jgi:hypothetical protein
MPIAVGILLSAGAARAETPVLASGDSFRLNGYASVEYERMTRALGKGDPNGSFDADLFDLVMNWQANDDIRVAADVTWEHGPASEDALGNVALEYGWVEYSVRDWLRFRGGKMFTPFGIYNEIHTAKPTFLTVKEPLATNKIDKFGAGFRFYPRWAMGLAALGNGTSAVGDWDYVVALSNGSQEDGTNPYEEDVNKQKAMAARFRLAMAGNVEVGASAYYDRVPELETVTDPISGAEQVNLTGHDATQIALGAQATWKLASPAIGLELEWVSGAVLPSPASGRRDVWAHGATAMLFWTIAEQYTPYLRVERLDPDSAVSNDQAMLYVAGVNVRLANRLIVKAEVDTVRAQDSNAYFAGGLGRYTEVKAAAVVGF